MFFGRHFNVYSANGRQCAGVIFGTPGTAYLRYSLAVYRRIFTQFSLHVWASEYTCRPMIANLLYVATSSFPTTLKHSAQLHFTSGLSPWKSAVSALSDVVHHWHLALDQRQN